MEAKFITLEGIEGSGKTSSIKSINALLEQKKIDYINTREPGESSIGEVLTNPGERNVFELVLILIGIY